MADSITVSGVTISTNVIATLVTLAAERVEGVAYVNGHNVATNLVSLITSKPTVAENTVQAEVVDDKLVVTLPVAVFFGYPFMELADKIRTDVAEILETQAGIAVGAVNVAIEELVFPKA